MASKNPTPEDKAPEETPAPLQPVVSQSPVTTAKQDSGVEPPFPLGKNDAWIVPLDKDGKEVLSEGFVINWNAASQQTFGDETKFSKKKLPITA